MPHTSQRTLFITRLVVLTSLTLTIGLVGLPQPVTGPLINLMLILTTLVLNALAGTALGIITPLVAVLRGQLPPVLAPMVPFIMISNILLVLIFAAIRRLMSGSSGPSRRPIRSASAWFGLISGSLVKTAWLYVSATLALPLLLGNTLPPRVIGMMALPQLITALIGGALAMILYGMIPASYLNTDRP
jgi:hypothetical protein